MTGSYIRHYNGFYKVPVLLRLPQPVVYGPLALQGLAVPHLHHTQGLSQVKKLLKHSDSPHTTTALLLCATLEMQQLESGLPGDPFKFPQTSTGV